MADLSAMTNALIEERTAKRREDSLIRDIFESLPVGVVVVDKTGFITVVNQAFETLSQYRREELVTKPIELLVPDAHRPEHRTHRENFMIAPSHLEIARCTYLKKRDGVTLPVKIGLRPCRVNGDVYIAATVQRDDTR